MRKRYTSLPTIMMVVRNRLVNRLLSANDNRFSNSGNCTPDGLTLDGKSPDIIGILLDKLFINQSLDIYEITPMSKMDGRITGEYAQQHNQQLIEHQEPHVIVEHLTY
jgi:hypothetical protein